MEQVYKRHIIRLVQRTCMIAVNGNLLHRLTGPKTGRSALSSGWNGASRAVLRPTKMPKWKPTFSPKTGLIIRTEFPLHKDPHTARRMLRAARRLSRERTHQTTNTTLSQ